MGIELPIRLLENKISKSVLFVVKKRLYLMLCLFFFIFLCQINVISNWNFTLDIIKLNPYNSMYIYILRIKIDSWCHHINK